MSLNDKKCCGNCSHCSFENDLQSVRLTPQRTCANEKESCDDIWECSCDNFEPKNPLNGETPKHETCRYIHPNFKKNEVKFTCGLNGDSEKPADPETCEICESYKSRWLQFPVTINKIVNIKSDVDLYRNKIGKFCAVRPCSDEYENKTFVGIFLGELPCDIHSGLDEKTHILTNLLSTNPAMFVPSLNKIIYGCESYWKIIDSPEEFKEISNDDIESQPYIQLLREMMKQNDD